MAPSRKENHVSDSLEIVRGRARSITLRNLCLGNCLLGQRRSGSFLPSGRSQRTGSLSRAPVALTTRTVDCPVQRSQASPMNAVSVSFRLSDSSRGRTRVSERFRGERSRVKTSAPVSLASKGLCCAVFFRSKSARRLGRERNIPLDFRFLFANTALR